MADWLIEIENELRKNGQPQNPGKTRTIARRIAGIAITELQRRFPEYGSGEDYYRALGSFKDAGGVPVPVAAAAQRLHERLAPDFSSPSKDPIGDAMVIVEFVKARLPHNNAG